MNSPPVEIGPLLPGASSLLTTPLLQLACGVDPGVG